MSSPPQDAAEELSPLDVVFYATLEVSGFSLVLTSQSFYESNFTSCHLRYETPWGWLRRTRMKTEEEEWTTAPWPDFWAKSWKTERWVTQERSWPRSGPCCSRRSTPSSGKPWTGGGFGWCQYVWLFLRFWDAPINRCIYWRSMLACLIEGLNRVRGSGVYLRTWQHRQDLHFYCQSLLSK